MKKLWDRLFPLDEEKSIWVEDGDLGKEIYITHKKTRYLVKIPKIINHKITMRLKGLGKTMGEKKGDLFLHVWLNKGRDDQKAFWISENTARSGAELSLTVDGQKYMMVIPPKSHPGLTLRLKGLGKEMVYDQRAPALPNKKRGDLLVKLFIYPDNITPQYGSFNMLSTEDMALEGWVYRKIDEITQVIGEAAFPTYSIQASTVAGAYNEHGWRGIFYVLLNHLNLGRFNIQLRHSFSISAPGHCEKEVTRQDNSTISKKYSITVNDIFLDNPFSVAAIMAHELCHVVYFEKIDPGRDATGYLVPLTEKETLEMEHSVDLLVFMFKMGEFQLRAARDTRFSLGYFRQELFERMQIIVARKANKN